MYVIKADGRKEEYSESKIVRTCLRSGVSQKAAKAIAKKITSSVHNGMTTHKIYTMILDELDNMNEKSVFMLREAVANLDPVSFELYVKKILESHGYRCVWNKIVRGMYVEHQVDVIAVKEKNFLVECKRHFNPHRFTGLGTCLQVQARLSDIMAGIKNKKNNYKFNAAWLITNTKFSEHAKTYAKGIGIRLSGWGYEGDFSMNRMVHNGKALPVTILKTDASVHKFLLRKKIITLQDFLRERPKVPNIKDLIYQSNELLRLCT